MESEQMRRIVLLVIVTFLLVGGVLPFEPATAQMGEPYSVWPSQDVYYVGDPIDFYYGTEISLFYGARLVIRHIETGRRLYWNIRPKSPGIYGPVGAGYAEYEDSGTWIMYLYERRSGAYVATSRFEVVGILYYTNETSTVSEVEMTETPMTVMLFTTTQQPAVTTTAFVTSTVEVPRSDLTSLISISLVALIAGLAVGLVVGRRRKARVQTSDASR
jgi:hypothetical protein